MIFSSPIFLVLFLPIVIFAYYVPVKNGTKPSNSRKNIVLLIASILFYSWGEPVFIYIMLLLILANWYLGIQISKQREYKKCLLGVAVVIDLLPLFVYKYMSFTLGIAEVICKKDFFSINIALPIGISFFTFQMVSYLLDVYYQKAKAQENILSLGLYIIFFPQLVAGPIVRYNEIEQEINRRDEKIEEIVEGLERFIYGLAKKTLLANYLAIIADNIFSQYSALSLGMSWLGAIAYTLQIYYDFSGYSDMAIGLGKVFGFHFAENFNYPYIATSITDFWKRWHISLSIWFRDYIYIPLGGNRLGKVKQVRNLFIVWCLTGFWHGANWTFLLWGLIYFFFIVIEKNIRLHYIPVLIRRLITITVVIFCWVIFRSDNIHIAFIYIRNMFGFNSVHSEYALKYYLDGTWFILAISLIGVFPAVASMLKKLRNSKLSFIYYIWTLIVFYLSFISLIADTYNPFIYFNF